jgi:DNA-binding transcriptional regulator LsrR (DeoR family)
VDEHPLTITRGYRIQWRRERICIDSAELAKLRWSEGWTIDRLAVHYGIGTTTLKRELSRVRSKSCIKS